MSGRGGGQFAAAGVIVSGAVAVAACAGGSIGALTGTVSALAAVGLVVLALVAGRLAAGLAVRRETAAARSVVADLVDAANRGDHQAVVRQMPPEQHQIVPPESLASHFPGHVVNCEVRRAQIVRDRSRPRGSGRLGKFVIRIVDRAGSGTDYVFLLVKQGRDWKVENWGEGDDLDLVEFGLA
ncbi:hypothetical protein OOK41_20630 [Micromonospora sp. NBC_01655]|uniref:hypothetical protein n=1 Tax=unclassified Micromonospora TaxID=2617518 RepID=UPI000E43AC85|nr:MULTISPECIES: hypothetical protein [unclassified Micromonospora]MCX4472684.1 hypothetical protein [Micromonospora sp. NBC_01655]